MGAIPRRTTIIFVDVERTTRPIMKSAIVQRYVTNLFLSAALSIPITPVARRATATTAAAIVFASNTAPGIITLPR